MAPGGESCAQRRRAGGGSTPQESPAPHATPSPRGHRWGGHTGEVETPALHQQHLPRPGTGSPAAPREPSVEADDKIWTPLLQGGSEAAPPATLPGAQPFTSTLGRARFAGLPLIIFIFIFHPLCLPSPPRHSLLPCFRFCIRSPLSSSARPQLPETAAGAASCRGNRAAGWDEPTGSTCASSLGHGDLLERPAGSFGKGSEQIEGLWAGGRLPAHAHGQGVRAAPRDGCPRVEHLAAPRPRRSPFRCTRAVHGNNLLPAPCFA